MDSTFDGPLPVFIVHWNRPMECIATIENFRQQGMPVSIRIVDNASRPECVEALRSGLPDGVELIQLSNNMGWGGGLNVLLKKWLAEEGADYCVVSAHDTILLPGCLALLVAAMEADKAMGISCPQYETPEIATFSPIRGISCIASSPLPSGEVSQVEIAHGTLMVFRKRCLAQIGIFDERYFAYGDEAEIGLRARKQGWTVGMVWGAVVINPGSWTSSPVVGYLSARSSLLMAADYGGVVEGLIRAILMLVNSLRLLFVPRAWNSMSSPRARLMAIRDFLLRRFGPIPPALLAKSSNLQAKVTAGENPDSTKS